MTCPRHYFAILFVLAGACPLLAAEETPPDQHSPDTPFANFESPQARPLIVSADGQRLYVVNTPANLLAVYSIADPAAPELIAEIPVGLEPVSVAESAENEVWVLNHLSDSVSVVEISRRAVVATIPVGDRPGDLVFAGSPPLAFVTSMTERCVRVIDPQTRELVKSIAVFGDDPRALLSSSDGSTVWVAISRSGNGTTVIPHTLAPPPPAPTSDQLPPAPQQGVIVAVDDPQWQALHDVSLPDHDVVEIDTESLEIRHAYSGVGTILFNLAQHPRTGEVWVANTHARNLVRFEPHLRGHVIDSRITRIPAGGAPTLTVVDLNPDLDYRPLPNPEALATALSQPTDIAIDRSGQFAFVAAFGTDRIGVLDENCRVVDRIELGGASGTTALPRAKRGPRGLATHPFENVLYVVNRLSNSLSVVDTSERRVIREINMFDPTPVPIREGRGFLFDAKLSGNGTVSCASCHVDGDRDGLAWDLGDPEGRMFSNGSTNQIHPMKGPLLTQTLRGLGGERIFHWRADRPGLDSFNETFQSLLGGEPLADEDLASLVGYLRSIRFGSNPHRNLDDTLSWEPDGVSARDGETLFLTADAIGREGSTPFRCVGCHVNPSGSGGFGFSGLIGQPMKAAQLRGLFERTGRRSTDLGRMSGFGYGADGSKDGIADFLTTSHRFRELTDQEKESLERFLMSFPTETAPAVGFAVTIDAHPSVAATVENDLALLLGQARQGRCDLIVKGCIADVQVGYVYDPLLDRFVRDKSDCAPMDLAGLLALVGPSGSVLTFMGVPPGTGDRLGIDRDADGILDGDH